MQYHCMDFHHPVYKLFYYFLFLFILSSFISGCMSKRPKTDPAMDQKALAILADARSAGSRISAVHGKGWVQFETEKINDRYRIVWAAVYPDKIRLTLLLYASPVETIIFKEEQLRFLSHTGAHKLHTRKSKNPNLEVYIGIPIRMAELISILLGRLPITGGDDIYFSPDDSSDDSSLSNIVIRDESNARAMHISLNPEKKISRIQFRHSAGQLYYEVLIQKYKSFPFGDIPVQIEVRDVKKRKLFIDITDFEPQTTIKDQVFQLTEPES
jgi:outer membrane lipoprotein-sorting protein